MGVTLGLIVEDVRFSKFLEPAVRQLSEGRCPRITRIEKTRGCRPGRLVDLFGMVREECDLVIVGVDSKTGGRRVSHRKKARSLRRMLDPLPGLVIAVADPSVEAWLVCDARSFGAGMHAGTGEPFQAPAAWPVPRSELEAKEILGRLIHDGCGGTLPEPFDFAPEIVQRMDLTRATNPSLADWAREFASTVKQIRG